MLRIFDVRQRMLQVLYNLYLYYISNKTKVGNLVQLFVFVERSGSTVTPCFIEKFSFEYYFSEKTLPALISVLPY